MMTRRQDSEQSLANASTFAHQEFAPPGPFLFRLFVEQVRGLTGQCVRSPLVRGNALLGRRPS